MASHAISCRIDGAHDTGDDFIHSRLVQRFDEARCAVAQARGDIEASDLVADRDAGRFTAIDDDGEPCIARLGASGRDRNGHAHA